MADGAVTNETPPADETVLQDSSAASLSKTFRALAANAREALLPFKPALAKLNELVTKFQGAGMDQVGFELASFDKLREYKLMNRAGSDNNALYGVLSIYDARFLVWVQEESKIVTYTENLNKPQAVIQFLDSDEFWYRTERSSGGTLKILRDDPKYNSYDLSQDGDVVKFMTAIAETTAALSAKDALREYDAPATAAGTKSLLKIAPAFKPKN
ncbi:MAG TPA: hypothetical protein VEF76_14980 [Patescibacteria group bacterium]|nr:hypothetical protein [Patescibacteria group bacterium]